MKLTGLEDGLGPVVLVHVDWGRLEVDNNDLRSLPAHCLDDLEQLSIAIGVLVSEEGIHTGIGLGVDGLHPMDDVHLVKDARWEVKGPVRYPDLGSIQHVKVEEVRGKYDQTLGVRSIGVSGKPQPVLAVPGLLQHVRHVVDEVVKVLGLGDVGGLTVLLSFTTNSTSEIVL